MLLGDLLEGGASDVVLKGFADGVWVIGQDREELSIVSAGA